MASAAAQVLTATPELPQVATASVTNSVFWYLLIPAIGLSLFYYWFSRRYINKLAAKIPGWEGLPFIGIAWMFLNSSSTDAFKLAVYYTKIIGEKVGKLWIGPRLFVYLTDPRDIELILGSQEHLNKSDDYRLFEPWLGDGLLITSGQKWRHHRKIIAPSFHLNILKSFVGKFNSNSKDVIERLRRVAGNTIDAHDYMSEATVEILLETAMGVNKKEQKNAFNFAMAVMKMSDILHLRHLKPWLNLSWYYNFTNMSKEQDKLLNIIHELTDRVIDTKKKNHEDGIKNYITSSSTKEEDIALSANKGLKDDLDEPEDELGQKKRLAFLDYLLESRYNGNNLSEEEINAEVNTIMFEGHDTTAAGSSFFLSMMGIHQEYQDKVVQELDEIFGDSDREVTFQDTLEMKYLERCLLETLRMYPPVPVIARELRKEVKLASKDLILPNGTNIIIATFLVHRDADTYPSPDVFNPDNFLPEKQSRRHYYSFIPFSAGPRSCVGRKFAMLKLKILLSTILRNFRVYSDMKETDFQLKGDLILKRSEGWQIRLEPRQKKTGVF